jgi:type IV secretory pathway VirB10-like protein
MKEIQFTEVTDEHDIQTKVNKLRNLLTKGHKVRVIINFKHKENFDAHTAHEIMNDILNRVDDISLRDSKTGLKFLSGGSAYSILIPKTETTTSLEKQPSTTQEKASIQQQQPQPQPQPQQQKQQPPKQQPQEKQQKQKPQVVASQISKTSDVDRLSIEHSTKQTEKEKKKKKAKRDEEIEEAEDFEEGIFFCCCLFHFN